jgi:hypothetical protein
LIDFVFCSVTTIVRLQFVVIIKNQALAKANVSCGENIKTTWPKILVEQGRRRIVPRLH